jgi:hypothetical protein
MSIEPGFAPRSCAADPVSDTGVNRRKLLSLMLAQDLSSTIAKA